MKKKLLVAFIAVLALVCLFTIAASAKTVTYEGQEIELVDNLGDPSWYTGNTALAIKDKESIVILKDSEGNMTAYPSYYILRFGVDVKDGVVTNAYVLWDDQNGLDYSFVNEKTGKSYAYGSIYYIEFPYGMTRCKNNKLFGRENGGAKETGIVEIVLPDSVNTIEGQAFRMMDNCRKINIPAAVTSLPSWAFSGSTKLETVVIAEGSLIESTGNSFSNCTALSSINLENCTNLKTLGASAFENCTSLRRISLPDSIETIENKVFFKIGEFELASDYLPKNLKKIGSLANNRQEAHFLSGCIIQNDVLYFPEGLTDFSALYNFNENAKYDGIGFTLVFLGKMTNIRIDNMDINSSFKGLKIVLAQNTFADITGSYYQYVEVNAKPAYIAKDSTGAMVFAGTNTGTLTISFRSHDPNSTGEAGKDENSNQLYYVNSITPQIILCGGDTTQFTYDVRNSFSGSWTHYYTSPVNLDIDAHKTAGVHWDKIDVVSQVNCGYDGVTKDTCVACKRIIETIVPATGDHIYTVDNDCTTSHDCTVCLKTVVEALEHVEEITVEYEKGFFYVGAKITACSNDGCEHRIVEELKALFDADGYSTDGNSVSHTIKVNKSAIETYEQITNKKVNYGTVAAAGKAIGTPLQFVGDELEIKDEAVMADMTGTEYTKLLIKISDIPSGYTVNCNAYAVIDKNIYYLCGDKTYMEAESKQF